MLESGDKKLAKDVARAWSKLELAVSHCSARQEAGRVSLAVGKALEKELTKEFVAEVKYQLEMIQGR